MGGDLDEGVVAKGNMVRDPLFAQLDRHNSHPSRTDSKPVSIIALGCFHPVMKVQSASVHFFLGSDDEKEDSDDEEDEVSNVYLSE